MNRRSSRLHSLERGLNAPRKPRTQARALTVMRLEGRATAAQSRTGPARLPKDIEEQIAVVRGRAVGKPSRGLLQLEERLLRTHDMEPATPVIQRYQHGAMPPVAAVRTPEALARAASLAGGAFGGRYNVESFEHTQSPMRGKPATALVTGYYARTAPAAITSIKAEVCAGTAPATTVGPPVSTAAASEQNKRRARQHALTRDQQAAAANFERDVAAMLGTASAVNAPEDRQWDDTLRNAAHAPAAPSAPAVGAAATPAAPRRDAHDVFSQMGLAMNFANSFDLGAMELSARFDHFDKELGRAPGPAPAMSTSVPVQALALDDFDLVADLAEIQGVGSATQTAAAPAGEQSAAKQDAPTATPT